MGFRALLLVCEISQYLESYSEGENKREMRAPSWDKNGLKKGTWTPEEDRKLIAYVTRYGCWNWRQLPKFAGLSRCGKSCRLRWMNYLRPDIKRGNFTKGEEDTVIRLHKALGNRWSAIAAELPGRTDNEIKNHWHTTLKKRVINMKQSNPPTAQPDETTSTNAIISLENPETRAPENHQAQQVSPLSSESSVFSSSSSEVSAISAELETLLNGDCFELSTADGNPQNQGRSLVNHHHQAQELGQLSRERAEFSPNSREISAMSAELEALLNGDCFELSTADEKLAVMETFGECVRDFWSEPLFADNFGPPFPDSSDFASLLIDDEFLCPGALL